jgi:hypothetical protein
MKFLFKPYIEGVQIYSRTTIFPHPGVELIQWLVSFLKQYGIVLIFKQIFLHTSKISSERQTIFMKIFILQPSLLNSGVGNSLNNLIASLAYTNQLSSTGKKAWLQSCSQLLPPQVSYMLMWSCSPVKSSEVLWSQSFPSRLSLISNCSLQQ